jgi:hypothetical protein
MCLFAQRSPPVEQSLRPAVWRRPRGPKLIWRNFSPNSLQSVRLRAGASDDARRLVASLPMDVRLQTVIGIGTNGRRCGVRAEMGAAALFSSECGGDHGARQLQTALE